ncbi:hypothetical protein PMKS-001803 [Pichia membranifaciens]|uniref:PCI domain-containing protein n=1 Tax=Pichia membranifaciens TaxID=4926 RepID=A0A1Q2YFJ6_9ASCO|nr:hypothetical protein PMKS-001803 [Pichia membranifaciens]
MTTEEETAPVASTVVDQLSSFLALIRSSAVKFDPRYILKVFRELTSIRRSIKADDLISLINSVYPPSYPTVEYLIGALTPFSDGTQVIIRNKGHSNGVNSASSNGNDSEMDVDTDGLAVEEDTDEVLPEIDIFIHLLVQIFLHDLGETKALHMFNKHVIEALKSYNKRTLDYIQAKAYNLVEKTEFPNEATNSVVARYYYYLARIQTIQLDYSSANECVITAIRKCPQTKNALGFLQSATKLQILIQLLTGEIPELSSFDDPLLANSLRPYSAVTKAVRLGDLTIFNDSLETFGEHLKKDNNYNLVLRLRQNVIKTGIRIISLSYKRISLKDICIKLHLDSELTAEYIVAKAIKDGVVDATINHTKGYMESDEVSYVYSTTSPQEEFDRRIKFCMQLHNDSVKAMRYPMNEDRRDVDADTQAREREQELLQFLQEEDF